MKLVLRSVLGAIIGLLVWAAITGIASESSKSSTSSTASAYGSTAIAIKVSAFELNRAYQKNEVAADAQYKGRLLKVDGIVESINKDFTDKIYLELSTSEMFQSVQAHMGADSEAKAASLKKGDRVTVVCTGAGMMLTSAILNDCTFTENEPPAGRLQPEPPPAAQTPEAQAPEPAPQIQTETSGPMPQGQAPMESVTPEGDVTYRVGNGVSGPVLIYSVEPELTEEARKAKFAGNVLVALWVGTDGLPSHVRVIRPVGMGLDEKAVEAVKQYKFKPAMKNGEPVLAELNIEVNFQEF